MISLGISQKAKKAIMIGSLCSVSYFAVYIARNILGAVTPQMVEQGYAETFIGKISSLYFITYAAGQLINGVIGDKIKAKYMICLGLLGAGLTNILFSLFAGNAMVAAITYGATGFFLSMIYGPMTKVVSENTEPIHATRCSLGYTFASFFGSPVAGVLAAVLTWQSVFAASSAMGSSVSSNSTRGRPGSAVWANSRLANRQTSPSAFIISASMRSPGAMKRPVR
jgi:sugar phosphate permease